jgi:hypothetical protein
VGGGGGGGVAYTPGKKIASLSIPVVLQRTYGV